MNYGTLYVVATPIGHLGDVSDRARAVLASVDVVAAEDTRRSGQLLKHLGMQVRWVSLHAHNEVQRSGELIARLMHGESVAIVSDAGTPLVSDPGQRLVEVAHAHGVKVVPVPGCSAVMAALSVAGLPANRFQFVGFLEGKAASRLAQLQALKSHPCTLVMFDAPHRIQKSMQALHAVFGPDRVCVICRELTKLYEQVFKGSLAECLAAVESGVVPARGEFVLVLSAASGDVVEAGQAEAQRVVSILLEALPPASAAKLAAKITGLSRNQLYRQAIELHALR